MENTLELFDAEIPRLRHRIKSVQLCFTTDPFMFGYEEVSFVDRIVFGRANYNRTVTAYPHVKEWYNACAEEVFSFCGERG